MRHAVSSLAILLLTVLAGCSGPSKPSWLSADPDDWANRSDSDDPAVLEVGGPIAIEVESFNGNVFIDANPKLTHATVRVQREAVHGYQRGKDAKTAMADVTWTAEIVPGDLGQKLLVRTGTTNAEPHYLRANIYIEAPDIEGVRVRTTNGKVRATDISGAVDINTTEGEVRVMTNKAMMQPVTIVTNNNDIHYRVRGESAGAFDGQTVRGTVTSLVKYGTLKIGNRSSDETLNAVLNQGTNPIMLRTVDGDIHIAVVHNPTQVGAWILN
jgi:hypothetical protein